MAAFPRPVFYQDPAEYLDYRFIWSDWLPAGDTIATATVTASTGITVDQVTNGGSYVDFWVQGGSPGRSYDITVHIESTQGRIGERTGFWKVVDL